MCSSVPRARRAGESGFSAVHEGDASADKTPWMTGKVEVRPGETISQALRRLHIEVRHATRRQLSKTRPGCYQKPSERRRLKERLRRRNVRSYALGGSGRNTVYLTLWQLHLRTFPFPGG